MKKNTQKQISIRFENVTKTFGSVKANENITFDANHEMAGKELNFHIQLVEVE
mgnify:CR=1 FL=1